jgi:DNA-binding beta-propeller fold protein YncE
VGLEVHGDRLYVCNLAAQTVEIFDRHTGEAIGAFGGPGDEDGQFRVPLGIDIDKDGFVYVCDMMRCRLQKFTPDGELVGAVGALGDVAGSFSRPKQIAVDDDGIVYVVDASFNNVQMFNADFELLMAFGAAGTFPGAMNLPAGICVTSDSTSYFKDFAHPGFEISKVVLVTNQFGASKIAAYAFGSRREGWTVADLSSSSIDVSAGVGINPEAARLQIPADAVDPELDDERP